MITKRLYAPDPIKVFIDISFLAKKTPTVEVNNSDIDEANASNVAPATCGESFNFSNEIYSRDGMK